MAYSNPGWVNDTSPYINQTNLNAISDTLANVPVANGGTGQTSHTTNAVLAGNGTSPLKNIASANGALYATGTNQLPQFGVLPVAQGGTGQSSLQAFRDALGLGNTTGALPIANGGTAKTSHTVNAILAGDGTNALKNIPTANGALYATGSGAASQFGTLPIAQGGTGAITAAAARNNLGLGNTSGALPIQNGGTGASSVAAARNNLGLGNTSGALPIANGGTGMTGVVTQDVNTGGGIRRGTVAKIGNVVTAKLATNQFENDDLVSQQHCIPSGFRPGSMTFVTFVGGNKSETDADKTVGVMEGYIDTSGNVVTTNPQQTSRGWYHCTVTYLTY